MAWTLTDLDKLEKAIANGWLTVQYKDNRVTYRSLAEMLQVRSIMRKALGLGGAGGASNDVHVNTEKGLG